MAVANLPTKSLPKIKGITEVPLDLPEFVESEITKEERYKCKFCKLFLSPVVIQLLCGHRIHTSCLQERQQSSNKRCVGDDEECKEVDVGNAKYYFPDMSITRELLRKGVYCLNKIYGCEDTMPWSKLAEHLEICQFVLTECKHSSRGCQVKKIKREIKIHEENECEYVFVICEICAENVLKVQLSAHMVECAKRIYQCRLHLLGCEFVGDNKDNLAQHMKKEVSYHIDLVFEACQQLKFDSYDSIIKDLKKLKNSNMNTTSEIEKSSKTIHDIYKKFDSKLKHLQKITAANAESIIELKKVRDIFMHVQPLQDSTRNHETRIAFLEVNKGTGASNLSGGTATEQEKQAVASVDNSVKMQGLRLNDMDIRLKKFEGTSFDGIYIWKILDYRKKKEEAVARRTTSIFSPPFYTDVYGYKLCLRLYPNGDGMGLGTHLSVYILLMKGEFDTLLDWPFKHNVSITLMDQETRRKPITDGFRPDPTSKSFHMPTTETNIASGFPLFAPLSMVESFNYLKDDTVFIKVKVTPYQNR